MKDQSTARFYVITKRIAKLEVSGGDGSLVLDSSDPNQVHKLGAVGSPQFFLRQPFSPDGGWDISPNGESQNIIENSRPIVSCDPLFIAWASGTSAVRGRFLVDQLPRGRYYLVRSALRPAKADYIYIGNETVRATPNMRVLLGGDEPVHATIIGSTLEAAPCLDQPLVGVVILRATGVKRETPCERGYQHSVVLFQLWKPPEQVKLELNGDLILIVPESGMLILDNLLLYSTNTNVRCKPPERPEAEVLRQWRDTFLTPFVERCAGGGMAKKQDDVVPRPG